MTRTDAGDVSLFTDLYELTMMQGDLETGHNPLVTFGPFFGKLPADRGYVVVAGLEQVVDYLETPSFSDDALAFLEDGGVATGFGPGTAPVTSEDAPSLDAVYKLVAVERDGELRPSMRLSPGKVTYPGRKSVRRIEGGSRFERDVLALREEDAPGDERLIEVFEDGEVVRSLPSLAESRARTREQLRKLSRGVRMFRNPDEYPVDVSDGLRSTTRTVRNDLTAQYRDGR